MRFTWIYVYLFAVFLSFFFLCAVENETLWINLLALKRRRNSFFTFLPILFIFILLLAHFFIIYGYCVCIDLFLLLFEHCFAPLHPWACLWRVFERVVTRKPELLIVNRSFISFLLCGVTFAYRKVIGDGWFFCHRFSFQRIYLKPNQNPPSNH